MNKYFGEKPEKPSEWKQNSDSGSLKCDLYFYTDISLLHIKSRFCHLT